MAELLLIVIVLLMVPKIIRGFKEGIRFAGRMVGWGIAGFILFTIIKNYFL
jgi:hypothetical protein